MPARTTKATSRKNGTTKRATPTTSRGGNRTRSPASPQTSDWTGQLRMQNRGLEQFARSMYGAAEKLLKAYSSEAKPTRGSAKSTNKSTGRRLTRARTTGGEASSARTGTTG